MKATLIFSILFFLLLPATSFCRLKGTWRQVFPEENGAIPGARRGHYMCSIGDQQVLMIGGGDRTYGRETWLYNYESNTWTEVPFEHELDTHFPTAWPYEFLCQISKNRVLWTFGDAYLFDLDSLKWFAINDTFQLNWSGVFLEENLVFGYTVKTLSLDEGYGLSELIRLHPEEPFDNPNFLTRELINNEEITKQGPSYNNSYILNRSSNEKYFALYDSTKVTWIPAALRYVSFMNTEMEIWDWLFLEQSEDVLPRGEQKKYSQLTKNATLMHYPCNAGEWEIWKCDSSFFYIIEYSPEANQMSTYQIDPPGNGVYNCKMAQIKDGVVMLFGGMLPTGLSNETWIFELDCLGVVDNTGENVNIYILYDNLYMLGDNLKDATLYNILGQKVVAVAGDKLDLNFLPIGVYFLQYNEKGVAKVVKVVRK